MGVSQRTEDSNEEQTEEVSWITKPLYGINYQQIDEVDDVQI